MNAQVTGTEIEQTTETAAVVEDAAAAATQTATQETTETTQTQQERDDAGKFRKPVQPRIDELTRKARENEREAAYWRQRAEAREAQDTAKAAPQKPTPDQFDDYGAYVEALTDFKADEKISERLKKRDEESAKQRETETRASTWKERQEAARATLTDYDTVMASSDVSIADHVVAALEDSEHGPALAYHMAKNPDVAERLNGLSPIAAAREIGRIEAKLNTGAASPDPKDAATETAAPMKPVKTTTAPPPVKPIASGRNTVVDLAKANMDDYVKQRKAQGARWAR